jgi:hypothetical protein
MISIGLSATLLLDVDEHLHKQKPYSAIWLSSVNNLCHFGLVNDDQKQMIPSTVVDDK